MLGPLRQDDRRGRAVHDRDQHGRVDGLALGQQPVSLYIGFRQFDLVSVLDGVRESKQEIDQAMARVQDGAGGHQVVEPLRISVPTSGIHYAFAKLYANQGDEQAWFRIAYASGAGAWLGRAASLVGALLVWLGVWLLASGSWARWRAIAVIVLGSALTLVTATVYNVGLTPALTVSVVIAPSSSVASNVYVRAPTLVRVAV